MFCRFLLDYSRQQIETLKTINKRLFLFIYILLHVLFKLSPISLLSKYRYATAVYSK